MAQFPFNPQQYQLQKALEKLPRGWYPAIVESSDILETNKKDGFRLVLTYLVIDGPAKGRKITKGYNIQNPNPQTVEIAMGELKTLCTCVGIFAPINQSEELHNRPLQIFVVEPKDSDHNDVKGYKDIHGTDPEKIGAGAPAPVAAQPPQGFAQPQYQQPPQQQAAAPAWAPPAAQAPASSASYPQQAQAQAPAQGAPAWAPPAAQAAPQQQQPQQAYQQPAPAWTPGGTPPQAPAWAPQR